MTHAIILPPRKLQLRKSVAEFTKVQEWDDIKAASGDDELVGFKIIVGTKHYEEG